MRTTTSLIMAAFLLGAAPAAAQNTATNDTNATADPATENAVDPTTDLNAVDAANGMVADPALPATTEPLEVDTTYEEEVADDAGRFPWGLLGLLGLLGLIPRKRRT